MGAPTMRVAGIQLSVSRQGGDANLAKAEEWIRRAAGAGAQLVCLQEYFGTGAFSWHLDPNDLVLAEPDNGPTVTRLSQLASELGIWLLVPFYECLASCGGRRFYAVAVVDSSGRLAGKYRKQYIALNERGYEKYFFGPGNLGSPVFQYGDIRFGVMVCRDRHFEEVARMYVLRGAHLIFVPTSTSRRSEERANPWIEELIALAASTGRYVVGVSSTGFTDGKDQLGDSAAVDPQGRIISRLGKEEGMILADVSPGAVRPVDERFLFRRDLLEEVIALLDARGRNSSPVIDVRGASGRRWAKKDPSW